MKNIKLSLSIVVIMFISISTSSQVFANGFGLHSSNQHGSGFSYKSSNSGSSASAINFYRSQGQGIGTLAYHIINHGDTFYYGYGAQLTIPESGLSLDGGAEAGFDILDQFIFQIPVGINKVISDQIEVYIEGVLTVQTSNTSQVGMDNSFGIRFYP